MKAKIIKVPNPWMAEPSTYDVFERSYDDIYKLINRINKKRYKHMAAGYEADYILINKLDYEFVVAYLSQMDSFRYDFELNNTKKVANCFLGMTVVTTPNKIKPIIGSKP